MTSPEKGREQAAAMTSYAVYDVETGEVVHLHVDPPGLDTSPEEVIKQADVGGGRKLDALRVPPERLQEALKVVDGELVASDSAEDQPRGAAGGGGGLQEPQVARRYERVRDVR